MNIRRLGAALMLLAAPLTAAAQPARKIPRIGMLGVVQPSPLTDSYEEAFRRGLRELGYRESQNIAIERRNAGGSLDRLPSVAAELIGLKVDVIVAPGAAAALAAKSATRTIPIVMVHAGDPIGSGLVASLSRPGANVTGLTITAGTEIAGKWLQLLKEAFPQISRVAILTNQTNIGVRPFLSEAQAAAQVLGLRLEVLNVPSPEEFDGAFAAMTRARADAFVALPEAVWLPHRIRFVGLAERSRLPALYVIREFVEAGGLMSYSASFPELYRRAATYVDKILRGANPADLPPENWSTGDESPLG